MVPGNTLVESDTEYAKVVNVRKRYPTLVNYPHDWSQFIQRAGKDKFEVEEMNQMQLS